VLVHHRFSPEQLRNMGDIQTQFSLPDELNKACMIVLLEIMDISIPMNQEVTDCSAISILFLHLLTSKA